MKSFFKTEKMTVDGTEITLREMSAGDSAALSAKDSVELLAIVCSLCVIEWQGETMEAIRANVPVRIMREVADRVFSLSGAEAKNSEPTPSADSSSA